MSQNPVTIATQNCVMVKESNDRATTVVSNAMFQAAIKSVMNRFCAVIKNTQRDPFVT